MPRQVDFRSFRTMHASLMRRTGARAEVTRDNMGIRNVLPAQNIYGKTWWDERAAAVSAVVDLVMKSDKHDPEYQQDGNRNRRCCSWTDNYGELEPQVEPLHQ